MTELRVHDFSISLDGHGAGRGQGAEHPPGAGGERLHGCILPPGGRHAVDERFVAAGTDGIGATIMGRSMSGPVRGGWPDHRWTGWRGEDRRSTTTSSCSRTTRGRPCGWPARRPPVVTDGIEAALERATAAAAGGHVRLGGGVATVRQHLRAGLLDELHPAVVPVLLGDGERLLGDLGDALDRWERVESAPSDAVAHVRLRRPGPGTGTTGRAAL